MDTCKCWDVRPWRLAVKDLINPVKPKGEVLELFGARSWFEFKDEVSDVMFGVGRLVGGLFGKEYVRMPLDGMHIEKVNKRVAEYGCIRSKNQVSQGFTCLNNKESN